MERMAGSAFYPHVWYTGILCRRDGSFLFPPKPESRPTKKTLNEGKTVELQVYSL